MYLKITGSCFSENIYKEIEALTNYGILYFRDIKYDENSKNIIMPIERFKIVSTKKVFFGMITAYKYDKNIKIPVLVIIKNITECSIENYLNDLNMNTIHILFGINVIPKTKEIYLGSVEEDEGNTCYSIKMKVSEIDIEIKDQ